ncbi:hypothetical protein NDK50_12580 [Paraburkholderia bryophila]|uniref:hypothetical protein n=1 Tax=Paraburkholderia bryophila TaxID=420952 RepID=UPI00234BBAA3|nr:hypothetical protein [Paraburkholderia bryophila]WCM18302.1 hypothetical protein NDK50_12580 [Paraburkholderia bryophila]
MRQGSDVLDLSLYRLEVRKSLCKVRHENGRSFEAQGATPIVLVAGCIIQMSVLLIYLVEGPAVGEVSPVAFGLFSGATVLLAHRWILVTMRRACVKAVAQHHVVLENHPPHIMKIAPTFPRRWPAMLYIQLHPELVDDGS